MYLTRSVDESAEFYTQGLDYKAAWIDSWLPKNELRGAGRLLQQFEMKESVERRAPLASYS